MGYRDSTVIDRDEVSIEELARAVDEQISEIVLLSIPGQRIGRAQQRRDAINILLPLWFELKRRLGLYES